MVSWGETHCNCLVSLVLSVDAYRSTRVKEMERPGVKQVIVRKENVCQRAEEPKGTSVFSIRQKMKVWAPDRKFLQNREEQMF